MIYDENPFRRRPRKINGNMRLTGEVRLEDGNNRRMAFRTPLSCQNWRYRAIGENKSLRNGVIPYTRAEYGNYLGNIGLIGSDIGVTIWEMSD